MSNAANSLLTTPLWLSPALNPYIGYQNASRIAKLALMSKQSVSDIVIEEGLMTAEQIKQVLDPSLMLHPTS